MLKQRTSFILPALMLLISVGIIVFFAAASAPAAEISPEPEPTLISTPEPTPTPTPTPEPTPTPTPAPEPVPGAEYSITVNKAANCVTVFTLGDDGETPLCAFICSCGENTPEGSFRLDNKWRWLWMVDDSYGQWVSQITGNILFHSLPYWGTMDPEQLDVDAFNMLGSTASHGCVRLRACDAKWIYDNVPQGTLITVYSDEEDPGPLGKPTAEQLPEWHTWDPSDPTVNQKCAERGCH